MSKIKEGLYIGNWRDAQNRAFLVNQKITHVLCAAAELRPVFPKEYHYLHINAQDSLYFNLKKDFERAADFIYEALQGNGRVFVHCYAGVSRSTSCVLSYLIRHERMKLFTALKMCKSKRPIVRPNPSFMNQLKEWEIAHADDGQNFSQSDSLAQKSTHLANKSHSLMKKAIETPGFITKKSTSKIPMRLFTPKQRLLPKQVSSTPTKDTFLQVSKIGYNTTRGFTPTKLTKTKTSNGFLTSTRKTKEKLDLFYKDEPKSEWRVRNVTNDLKSSSRNAGFRTETQLNLKKSTDLKPQAITYNYSTLRNFKRSADDNGK